MEFYKRKCLKDFLERTKVSLEVFVEFIRKKESKLRAYYAENIALSSHDFVKMILVDASFIFEVLFVGFFGKRPVNDRVYNKPWLLMDVMNDLFVLENQLPFFILEDLLSLANIEIDHERVSMIKITHKFSCEYWDICKIENLDEEHYSKVGHFVDFVRIRALPSNLNVRKDSKYTTIPSVTELHQAGVRFKLSSSTNLFDIRFNNGILEIPKIKIGAPTECLLRNLLAFEQCNCPANFINDYVVLMNFLLKSSKDVDLLVKNGIIVNWHRDSEGISILFRNLVELASFHMSGSYYFSSIAADLNSYCEASWHKWMATLRQDYFKTPWSIISFIAAVILLLLTFTQTMFSIPK
ncbi:UPF0481 protein At3g47200-like [Pistacia vera]|uniref:UPF0481 protein At3g47200-like n=1 Tax=Pistacia vera TaxID=55513 RepID=UPI0012630D75|nr:UPF0481 protein At3g47200-like [Pistacia vera]